MVTDADMLKEIMVKQFSKFTDRDVSDLTSQYLGKTRIFDGYIFLLILTIKAKSAKI